MSGGRIERILWSLAFPGLGQILNGQLVKAFLFIGLELLVNIKSNLNKIILLSFYGQTAEAVKAANYPWLMFYPCLYMFAVWDACRHLYDTDAPFFYLPLILAAYFGTLGTIYSSRLTIGGFMPGPVFLPILCMASGAVLGWLVMLFLRKRATAVNKNRKHI